jgi:hypothetical protein
MDWIHWTATGVGALGAMALIRARAEAKRERKASLLASSDLGLALSALGELREDRDRMKRHKAEFFGIIEGLEKERDQWRKLYETNAGLAGNAQQWLFRAVDRLHAIANVYAKALGKPAVPSDPSLDVLKAALGEAPALPEAAAGASAALEAKERQDAEVGSHSSA